MTARPLPPLVEITVYLTDGRKVRFAQTDGDAVQKLKDRLNPARLFTQETLLLGNPRSLTAFPTAHVVRVDFKSAVIQGGSYLPGLAQVVEITGEEFRARHVPQKARRDLGFAEIELSGGEVVYLQLHFRQTTEAALMGERTTMEPSAVIDNLFSGNSMFADLPGGGLMVINPARILRFTFHPAPAVLPVNVWRAEPIA